MNSSRLPIIVMVLVLAFIVVNASFFTLKPSQTAVLLRLGKIEKSDFKPGLHFKIPFVTSVRKYDARELMLDARPSPYLTVEQKNVIVDSFVIWRITDVAKFYTSIGSEYNATERISPVINSRLRDAFGRRTIQQVISSDRDELVKNLISDSNKQLQKFGITVTSVRIKRIDLPPEVSASVYSRMEAERERVAKQLRSKGAEEAEKIKSDADRQRTIILANAERDAQRIRGEGEAQASTIYSNAYSQNKDFYALYRRLNAYKNVFHGNDMLVVEPKGEFFGNFDSSKINNK